MKKTALTFGLFSLVMVATSFAAPQNSSTLADLGTEPIDGGATGRTKKLDLFDIDGGATGRTKKLDLFDIDGGATGRTKKLDFHASNFASVNQSVGSDRKID